MGVRTVSPAFQRDALLDAAEAVILKEGIGALTLDAVARHAKVSKGGLMHHFRTKDALITAMVERTVTSWRADVRQSFERTPAGPGRLARAMLGLCLEDARHWNEQCRRSSLVLVAALASNPALVQPLRDCHREFTDGAADGLEPGHAEAVVLAIDGLWFKWMLGLTDVSPKRLAQMKSALDTLLLRGRARTSKSSRTPSPRTRGTGVSSAASTVGRAVARGPRSTPAAPRRAASSGKSRS